MNRFGIQECGLAAGWAAVVSILLLTVSFAVYSTPLHRSLDDILLIHHCGAIGISQTHYGHSYIFYLIQNLGLSFETNVLLHSFIQIFLVYFALIVVFRSFGIGIVRAVLCAILCSLSTAPLLHSLFIVEDDLVVFAPVVFYLYFLGSRMGWKIPLLSIFAGLALLSHLLGFLLFFLLLFVPFELFGKGRRRAIEKVMSLALAPIVAGVLAYLLDKRESMWELSSEVFWRILLVERSPEGAAYPTMIGVDYWLNVVPRGFYESFFQLSQVSNLHLALFFLLIGALLLATMREALSSPYAQMAIVGLLFVVVYEPSTLWRWSLPTLLMSVFLVSRFRENHQKWWLYGGFGLLFFLSAVPILYYGTIFGPFERTPETSQYVRNFEILKEQLRQRPPRATEVLVLPEKMLMFDSWLKGQLPEHVNSVIYEARCLDGEGSCFVHLSLSCQERQEHGTSTFIGYAFDETVPSDLHYKIVDGSKVAEILKRPQWRLN